MNEYNQLSKREEDVICDAAASIAGGDAERFVVKVFRQWNEVELNWSQSHVEFYGEDSPVDREKFCSAVQNVLPQRFAGYKVTVT